MSHILSHTYRLGSLRITIVFDEQQALERNPQIPEDSICAICDLLPGDYECTITKVEWIKEVT